MVRAVPTWPTLRAVGTKNGQVGLTVNRSTTDSPAAVRSTADKTRTDARWADISHVAVEIVDHEGCVVSTAENKVVFELNGPGRKLGLNSGKPTATKTPRGIGARPSLAGCWCNPPARKGKCS
jgi:beta-galactosidase